MAPTRKPAEGATPPARPATPVGNYFDHEQLEAIGASLSMGDVWRVRDITDETERGAQLYYQSALRIGQHTGDLESFLDRILERDFDRLVTAGRTSGVVPDSK